MVAVDAEQITMLREVLSTTGWLDRTREFGRALRATSRTPGGLLLVGTPAGDPWHLAAHLDDESRLGDAPGLAPTLVRWRPPADAPGHLRIGLERLEAARRGETLFVVAEEDAPVPLLERVDDARRTGATVLALEGGDRELRGLAHEALTVPPGEALLSFDGAQHLVSAAARRGAGPRPARAPAPPRPAARRGVGPGRRLAPRRVRPRRSVLAVLLAPRLVALAREGEGAGGGALGLVRAHPVLAGAAGPVLDLHVLQAEPPVTVVTGHRRSSRSRVRGDSSPRAR
nr:hypothetical protein [Actinomadura madurae]